MLQELSACSAAVTHVLTHPSSCPLSTEEWTRGSHGSWPTPPGGAEMPLNVDQHHTNSMLLLYTSKIKDQMSFSCFVIVFPTPPSSFRKECVGSVSQFGSNKTLSVPKATLRNTQNACSRGTFPDPKNQKAQGGARNLHFTSHQLPHSVLTQVGKGKAHTKAS